MLHVEITDVDKQKVIADYRNRDKIAIVEDYREFTLQQINAELRLRQPNKSLEYISGLCARNCQINSRCTVCTTKH